MEKQLNSYFIELEDSIDPEQEQPASYVRRSFWIEKEVEKAELYITALGVYEGYLNGEKLGNQILTPGYTDYNYRVQYQKYEVTGKLCIGENVIAAVVGDGWYRGCIDIGSKRNCYGTKLKFMCCLLIQYKDGSRERVNTDENWRTTQEGPLRENNIKTIEKYDARLERKDWKTAGYDDSRWNCGKSSVYGGKVILQQGELVLEQEHFIPKVLHTPDGNVVLDMGQNFAGYVSFQVSGKEGREVSLTMGEVLDENGNFTMKNLSAEGASSISGEVGQKLVYILKEGKQSYHPHFLVSGFRYVLVENWPEQVKAENFKGIAVYSDIKMQSTFECSNKLVNQLVENVRWSQKSNFVDIPGDCPTRERSGWTADISVFSETACYLSDPRKFLKKWIQDYKLEQSSDGNLPYVVPSAGKGERQRGCMGWSNAIANVSMELYKFYGKKEDLEDVYDCVRKFVDFNVERAKEKNPFFFYKFGRHRRYMIETGFHYGEWLEPGHPMYKDYIKDLFFPDTEVTTAWFYKTTMQLIRMAEILDKKEDAEKYRALAENIREAYRKEFLKGGKVHSKRQCRYVRPLDFGLANQQEEASIAKTLNDMCRKNEYKIGTGFLTTYKILEILTRHGYAETAYKMLENTEQPGWLFAVTKGATTTWENWYGIDRNGVPVDSHNHFAPGAVVAWLFAYSAGIQPSEPGFRRIKIQPVPGGSFSYVNCSYQSAVGKIAVKWKMKQGIFSMEVYIPDHIPVDIILPDGSKDTVIGGTHTYEVVMKKER